MFAGTMFGQTMKKNGLRITFLLHAPNLSTDSTVYITGSDETLGFWNPAEVKMDYAGDHSWRKEIVITEPIQLEYKYTLGSWEREGANADKFPLSNFSVHVSRDTIVQDSILFWTSKTRPKRISTITGMVKYHYNFKGDSILARDVLVWLPPDYDSDRKRHYPVIYMQDGQNIFDAATSSFGNEWRADETCDSLIRAGKIPSVIVVAINNTSERSKEYVPGKKGSAYMDFVIHKLKPFIDITYRTKTEAQFTTVVGSSAGGTIAFMLVWEYPDIFSKAICMSPALKIDNIDYVNTVKESVKKRDNIFFYIYNGGIDLESKLQPGINEMITALKEKGYHQGTDYKYFFDPQGHHNETAWAKRLPQALEWCFRKK